MINFNQLRVFYHAAKYQNLTAAARELYITQPAVTSQVKAFEEACGMKLFKKRGRHVYLTDQGRTLLDYAERIFDYEKEFENVIAEMRELKRGVLRLGTTKAYARYFMPRLISNFIKAYPQIKINLDEGSSLDMTHSLLTFKNEVAVIAKAEEVREVTFVPFSQEEMVVIAAADHPLAGRTGVSFDQIAGEPFIMKEVGSGTRRLVADLFESRGFRPNVLMETSNAEFIKQLVERGEGISILTKAGTALELGEGKLSPIYLKNQSLILDVSIAYLKDQPLSPPARAFIDTLESMRSGKAGGGGIGELMGKILGQPW
jgi:DNA-binding transcriptional LysR family regulator